MTREPKKTEMLEIRVSSETKSALQAKARDDGKSVSEVLRHLIAQYLGLQPLGETSCVCLHLPRAPRRSSSP